eukprot:7256419-Alexandrium_andersonii.AAC.1
MAPRGAAAQARPARAAPEGAAPRLAPAAAEAPRAPRGGTGACGAPTRCRRLRSLPLGQGAAGGASRSPQSACGVPAARAPGQLQWQWSRPRGPGALRRLLRALRDPPGERPGLTTSALPRTRSWTASGTSALLRGSRRSSTRGPPGWRSESALTPEARERTPEEEHWSSSRKEAASSGGV